MIRLFLCQAFLGKFYEIVCSFIQIKGLICLCDVCMSKRIMSVVGWLQCNDFIRVGFICLFVSHLNVTEHIYRC